MIRIVIAVLLAVEAVNAMLWLSGVLTVAGAHGGVVLMMVALRAAVTALQMASAWMLIERTLSAVTFSRLAFSSSAVLLVLEIGFRLSPSSLTPDWRWPIVVAYAIYAAGCIGSLKFVGRD